MNWTFRTSPPFAYSCYDDPFASYCLRLRVDTPLYERSRSDSRFPSLPSIGRGKAAALKRACHIRYIPGRTTGQLLIAQTRTHASPLPFPAMRLPYIALSSLTTRYA